MTKLHCKTATYSVKSAVFDIVIERYEPRFDCNEMLKDANNEQVAGAYYKKNLVCGKETSVVLKLLVNYTIKQNKYNKYK